MFSDVVVTFQVFHQCSFLDECRSTLLTSAVPFTSVDLRMSLQIATLSKSHSTLGALEPSLAIVNMHVSAKTTTFGKPFRAYFTNDMFPSDMNSQFLLTCKGNTAVLACKRLLHIPKTITVCSLTVNFKVFLQLRFMSK